VEERVEEEARGGERQRGEAEMDAQRQSVAVELRGLTDGDFSSAPAGERPAPGRGDGRDADATGGFSGLKHGGYRWGMFDLNMNNKDNVGSKRTSATYQVKTNHSVKTMKTSI
jgi:hypothetical protein